ncbi:apolipoprotein N-acyltransferase [bacterium]|nr:MAG: apolipoprotein N-acyltransferase [bacterium]
MAPWLISLRETTPRQAWNRGYAFGLLFSLTQLWWLGDLVYKWTGNAILGIVPWLLASLLSAVYYGLLGRLVRTCYGLNALWVIPLVWAGMELFRSYIPVFAFPWALLGEPLVGTPVIGLAWFGTIFLASAFVVAINIVLSQSHHRLTRSVSLLAVAAVLFVFWSMNSSSGADELRPPRVGAGQPGVDLAFDREAEFKIPEAVEELVGEAQRADLDLLILPEGIAPRAGGSLPPTAPFNIPKRPALVFGGQRGTGPLYQSAFSHDEKGWGYADKTRLVIFGEFVPGRSYLPFLAAFELPAGDLSAGAELGTLQVGGHRVGPLICFEALFPDLAYRQARKGATMLAVMSNDDWFALPARERLANASRWRAVEAGLPLVRAGSLGRSMIVSWRGDVLEQAPFGVRRLVIGPVDWGRGPFPLVWLFPLVAAGSLVAVPLRARRTRKAAEASQ